MSKLAHLQSEIGLARRFPVSVLITAPSDLALKIARAIADAGDTGQPRLTMFDGAAILDAADPGRRNGTGTADDGDLVVRDVYRLNEAQQVALMALLETHRSSGHRRIIATSRTHLFDLVQQGTFKSQLFYRLNVIHIVSDAYSEERSVLESYYPI